MKPVCMLTGSDLLEGRQAIVSGWGSLKFGTSKFPSELYSVDVKVWNNPRCNSNYGPQAPGGITRRMLCASKPGKDSCQVSSILFMKLLMNDFLWFFHTRMDFECTKYLLEISGWFWRCSFHMQKQRWLYSNWYCFLGNRLCPGPISRSLHSSHWNDWLDSKNYLMLLNKRYVSF